MQQHMIILSWVSSVFFYFVFGNTMLVFVWRKHFLHALLKEHDFCREANRSTTPARSFSFLIYYTECIYCFFFLSIICVVAKAQLNFLHTPPPPSPPLHPYTPPPSNCPRLIFMPDAPFNHSQMWKGTNAETKSNYSKQEPNCNSREVKKWPQSRVSFETSFDSKQPELEPKL
jgi:hypothetical protein